MTIRGRNNGGLHGVARSVTARIAIAVAAVLPAAVAPADDDHRHSHRVFHDGFYERLIRPDTGNPCCNNGDCRSTSGRMAGTSYEVKVNGAWIKVPWEKVVRERAPDLGYHVCAPPHFSGQSHQLYCVVLPPES